jgi:hypothetical protein
MISATVANDNIRDIKWQIERKNKTTEMKEYSQFILVLLKPFLSSDPIASNFTFYFLSYFYFVNRGLEEFDHYLEKN